MASYNRRVKPKLRKALIEEAGGKCANPGCSAWQTHLHHIKEWAVYKTHDAAHTIAVCPTCHDAIHHGRLKIDDATLYTWKRIKRPAAPKVARISVEPSSELMLRLGSLCLSTSNTSATIFELSNTNRLAFEF